MLIPDRNYLALTKTKHFTCTEYVTNSCQIQFIYDNKIHLEIVFLHQCNILNILHKYLRNCKKDENSSTSNFMPHCTVY